MPIESRSNSALFRRAEQLKRWHDSDTNKVSANIPKDKNFKIKFGDGCVFLAACAASDTDEVERLLNHGTDINTANVDGLTALHQACIDNNLEMVQFLVEHGCEVNQGDNEGWTPLHATASCGFLSIAKYLIEHGANVAAVNNDGDLPIDIAESSEMEEYLSDVLDEKAIDCDLARSEEERIMLKDAKSMVESGIDLNDRTHPRTGATPLHVASAKGYIDVLKLLIQGGVDLNAQDTDGWTPLHAAAHWGQKEACAILADNLANMDIQNLAGQTCYDVAEPELVKLLEELKKKQTHMQKDRPDIQAILQRTSNRPPLKRRTSVTRMSGHEKSKSVMKDTKSERAQIENLCLPEEEIDEDKVQTKKNTENLQSNFERFSSSFSADKKKISKEIPPKSTEVKDEIIKSSEKAPVYASRVSEKSQVKDTEIERIPSWKKVLRKSAEDRDFSTGDTADTDVAEITLKRPKKPRDSGEDNSSPSNEGSASTEGRSPQDESELQRKAHAKRVRETRRSTQGVLLEDLKSAELQYLINTQQNAAKRQAEEAKEECVVDSSVTKREVEKTLPKDDSSKVVISQEISSQEISSENNAYRLKSSKEISPKDTSSKDLQCKDTSSKDTTCKDTSSKDSSSKDTICKNTSSEDTTCKDISSKYTSLKDSFHKDTSKDHLPLDNSSYRTLKHISGSSKDTSEAKSFKPEKYEKEINEDNSSLQKKDKSSNETPPSVTLVLRSKSSSTPEDTSPTDKSSLGTQAAIQRRRRPKRRSTGVVYLDSDDGQEEKEKSADKENASKREAFQSERARQRCGSSSSIPDTASEASSRNEFSSNYSSRSSLNEEENKEYKRLYEETKKENERLKETLKKTEEELEKTKKQLQRLPQNNSYISSLSETEKKERRTLERKISEMEEELKNVSKLKNENEKLKAENRALSRMVCKLSK